MGNLFGRFWKMALLSKICCLYFWSKLCYFLFQHLVTLGSCMIPIFFVAKKVHCPIFFFHPFSCFSSRKFSDENLLRNIKNQFRLKFCAQMADVLPADLVVVYQVRSCTLKSLFFIFKWSKPRLFLFIFFLFACQILSTNLTINDKSIYGVLGSWTWGGRVVGTDESTELWRHPKVCYTNSEVDFVWLRLWPDVLIICSIFGH